MFGMNSYPFDPADFRPLFEVTSELRELTISPADLSWARHARILRELCFSLTSAFDKGFEQVLHSAQANAPETKQFARHILSDFAAFTEFLKFEKDVLVKCGVDQSTADAIVAAIRPLHDEIRQMNFDPSKTASAIQNLRDEVCKASHSARRVMDRAKAAADDKRRMMKTYGIVAIVANLSSIAVTMAATTPYAAISTVGGGLLVAVRTDVKNPPDHPPR